MNRIVISREINPFYNLALEEELLGQADSGTLLYLWVNRPCVVLGRNQNPYMECDMDYLRSSGVTLVRRRSGGGAVYQDQGNLNYTFINREGEGSQDKQRRVLLGMLSGLGVNAVYSGRNDILIEGRKVSGQAGYCEDENEYVHGTLMVHVNMVHLQNSLRPSGLKLESKGVRSAAARVINLSELIPDIGVEQAGRLLAEQFVRVFGPCAPVRYMDESKGRPVKQDVYESREWITDNCPAYTACLELPYLDGILKLKAEVRNGIIINAVGSSDSLYCNGIDWIEKELYGIRFDIEQIITLVNIP